MNTVIWLDLPVHVCEGLSRVGKLRWKESLVTWMVLLYRLGSQAQYKGEGNLFPDCRYNGTSHLTPLLPGGLSLQTMNNNRVSFLKLSAILSQKHRKLPTLSVARRRRRKLISPQQYVFPVLGWCASQFSGQIPFQALSIPP